MEYISTYFFAVTCSCIRSMHLILWTLINSQHQSHTITTSKFVLPVKFACLSFCLSVCLSVSRNKHKFQCSHMQLYKIDAFDPKDLKSLHQSHTNSSIKICVYCLWSLLACLSVCLSVCPSGMWHECDSESSCWWKQTSNIGSVVQIYSKEPLCLLYAVPFPVAPGRTP